MPGILYFGFGGIVSPGLRELRGIETEWTKAAIVKDHRLTFAVAGGCNIVRKRGYEVHGVLMELSQKDWDIVAKYDVSYDFTTVECYPYGEEKCYKARCFVMDGDEIQNEELPKDKLPQERFLRIIASGMRHHGIEEEYIENEVMNCPYIPTRKSDEYLRFPEAPKMKEIPEAKYLKEAKKRNWFAIGRRVFWIPVMDKSNKMVTWLEKDYIGKLDVTWTVSRTLYDPDLPKCSSNEELTDLHHAWCENMMVDYFAQSELEGCQMVGILIKEEASSGCKLKGFVKRLSLRRSSKLKGTITLPDNSSFFESSVSENPDSTFESITEAKHQSSFSESTVGCTLDSERNDAQIIP